MENGRVWYISGPMTGLPDHNYPLFHEAEKILSSDPRTEKVYNPARNFEGRTDLEWSTYMKADIEQVLQSTDVLMLPGWQNSKGARIEFQVAKSMGLGIHGYTPEVALEDTVEASAADLVRNGQRQREYGPPIKNATRIASIWTAILGREVTPEQVALCLLGVKMARLSETPGHRDSIIDAIGYSIYYDRIITGE